MIAKQILPVVLAAAGLASAQSSDKCSQTTIEINSQADATGLSSCSTLKGNVVIGENSDNTIDLSGPKKIDGDLVCKNNGKIVTIKSSSLGEITGDFTLSNVTILSTLSLTGLTSVGSITWNSLYELQKLGFTTGVTKAKSVKIADTKLDSLDGIDLSSVAVMDINNNKRLVSFESSLSSLTDTLNINANGNSLEVKFPNLKSIANMTISGVSSFEVPALGTINGSCAFVENDFESFTAPNLTQTQSGSILSFVSNNQLTNISLPALTKLGGGLLIANNTELGKIDSIPQLKAVSGDIKFRGVFDTVSLPALDDVGGAFDVVSTENITSSCANFDKLAPSKFVKGGNGHIQGTYTCKGKVSNANNDTSASTGKSGTGSDSSDKKNAAGAMTINGLTAFGLVAVGALFQLL